MEYYSAIKNEIVPFAATRMDLEMIILNEVSQTDNDKYHDIIYRWNLKIDTNVPIYKTERLRFRKETYSYQTGKVGWRRYNLGGWD